MTKAEEVFTQVEELVASGSTKADAFKQLAERYGQPVNSIRGAYYAHRRDTGTTPRPRRRETTLEDSLAEARRALERSIERIDREIEAAANRAAEAEAEHEALKESAAERKAAITERLEALK
jgi:chromosome segregation ATPase